MTREPPSAPTIVEPSPWDPAPWDLALAAARELVTGEAGPPSRTRNAQARRALPFLLRLLNLARGYRAEARASSRWLRVPRTRPRGSGAAAVDRWFAALPDATRAALAPHHIALLRELVAEVA